MGIDVKNKERISYKEESGMDDHIEDLKRRLRDLKWFVRNSVSLDEINNILSLLGSEELMNINIGSVKFNFDGNRFCCQLHEAGNFAKDEVHRYKISIYLSCYW
jgi:hypothetical protein